MYNWGEIKQEWLAGETMLSISQERDGRPTVSAISKKAKKENWSALVPSNKGRTKAAADRVDTRAKILDYLEHGATFKLAAEGAGISVSTLDKWRRADEDYDAACKQAAASVPLAAMKRIVGAANGGDIGAAKFVAERHPESKHDYGPAQPQGGGAPQIVINIPRHESELPAVNRVIEHQSE